MKTTVNLPIPDIIRNDIVALHVLHFNFQGEIRNGIIEVNRYILDETKEAFHIMFSDRFPINSVIPIIEFGNDDDLSMDANNSSGFNYRTITNQPWLLSKHADGSALDINPMQNPYINGEKIYPPRGVYDPTKPGTLLPTTRVVKFFKAKGFIWGGDWDKPYYDYQHLEKELPEFLKVRYKDLPVNQNLL